MDTRKIRTKLGAYSIKYRRSCFLFLLLICWTLFLTSVMIYLTHYYNMWLVHWGLISSLVLTLVLLSFNTAEWLVIKSGCVIDYYSVLYGVKPEEIRRELSRLD